METIVSFTAGDISLDDVDPVRGRRGSRHSQTKVREFMRHELLEARRYCSSVPTVGKVSITASPDATARRCSASHSIADRYGKLVCSSDVLDALGAAHRCVVHLDLSLDELQSNTGCSWLRATRY